MGFAAGAPGVPLGIDIVLSSGVPENEALRSFGPPALAEPVVAGAESSGKAAGWRAAPSVEGVAGPDIPLAAVFERVE